MNNKQTAVEWLVEQIENKNGKEFSSYYSEFLEQAKEMEKEQVMNAYGHGVADEAGEILDSTKDAEQYYRDTYGG